MKFRKRITSVFLCASILCGSLLLCSTSNAATTAQQKNQLESRLEAQKKEQQRIQANLNKAKADVDNQLAQIQLIYDDMNACQNQIQLMDELIVEYRAIAKAKEAEIDQLNQQMDKNFQLFKQRLQFAQESGSMSYIDFILGSSTLSDIISRAEVINDMLSYDRKIIEGLDSDRKAVEKAKTEIEEAMKSAEEKKAEQEKLVETLGERKADADNLLASLQNDQQKLQQAYTLASEQKKKVEQELDAVIKQIAAENAAKANPTPAPSTGFIWPLPLSAKQGFSRGYSGGHSGIDIHTYGVRNAVPAISIAAGEVVRADHGNGWNGGWGNLVVVDHGGGYLSYYAHLDTVSVSIGQKIAQGQQVGLIGSTGDSTGAHLHLTLYVAGRRVDPLLYIPKAI